jgi:hypothetical protein
MSLLSDQSRYLKEGRSPSTNTGRANFDYLQFITIKNNEYYVL